MNNDFKKRLEVKQLPNTTFEKEALDKYKKKEVKKYLRLYENKDIQEYLHTIVAAIMLSQNEHYEDFSINIPYRFKSYGSIEHKLEAYISKNYNEEQEFVIDSKLILDVFAMKVIAGNRPPTFYSTDENIKNLIEEKKQNHVFLGEMQNFRARLLEDEYSNPKKYKYECTKVEYYENCKKILEKLKTLVDSPEKEYNLINRYNSQISDIDNCLDFLYATNDVDELINTEDLLNKNMNFFSVLKEFEHKVHNKLDLAVLTKQFTSLFDHNETFEQLGVHLSEITKSPKRTPNGFEANFIYLDTLFGPIECQLQTDDQYKEGNYGFAAHTKLTGKAIKPLPLPDVKDRKKINEFVKQVKKIAPKSFSARMDGNEPNRVMLQQFSDYQNYKNSASQVTKGDPAEKYILNYFGKLYAIKDKIFKTRERSLGYVKYDIDEYIKSERFKKLKEKALNDKER